MVSPTAQTTASPGLVATPIVADATNVTPIGGGELWVVPAEGGKPTLLASAASLYASAWSPQGDVIAVAAGNPSGSSGAIKFIRSDGTLLRSVQLEVLPNDVHWSRDGKGIAFTTSDSTNSTALFFLSATEGSPKKVASIPGNVHPQIAGFAADGRLIAGVIGAGGSGGELTAYSLDDGASERLGQSAVVEETGSSVVLTTDGTRVAFAAQRADGVDCGNETGYGANAVEIVEIASGAVRSVNAGCRVVSLGWSNDGTRLAIGTLYGLYGLDSGATQSTKLADGKALVEAVTADGRILYQLARCWGCDGGTTGPFDVSISGGESRQLGESFGISVSRTSDRLLANGFDSLMGKPADIREITGGISRTIASPPPGRTLCCAEWVPGDALVSYVATQTQGSTAWRLGVTGEAKDVRALPPSAMLSPDGKHIAISGSPVKLSDLDGSNEVSFPQVNTFAGWLPDSSGVLATALPAADTAVSLARQDGTLTPLLTIPGSWSIGAASPDSSRVVVSTLNSPVLRVYDLTTGRYDEYPATLSNAYQSFVWSADSKYVSYIVGTEPVSPDVYVLDVANKTSRRVTQDGQAKGGAAISPDGTTIAYSTGYLYGAAESDQLLLVDLGGESPQTVATVQGNFRMLTWSPDGRHIAVIGSAKIGGQSVAGTFVVAADGSSAVRIEDGGTIDSLQWADNDSVTLVSTMGGL